MDFAVRYQDRVYNRLATSGKPRSDCTAIAAEADAEIAKLRAALRTAHDLCNIA